MAMGCYVVDAVLLEGRSAREVAAAHGISKSWIYELVRRYRAGGYEALEPRSRRPRSCKHETSPEIVGEIVEVRGELDAQGHDAGAETIAYHLAQQGKEIPSVSTIWRILRREGLVVPSRTSVRAARWSASRRICPTRCGKRTSPAGSWPRARLSRS
jgi:transposase